MAITAAPVAVTGATGYVGGRVAARLATRGVPMRLVVRDAGRAPAVDGAEVAVATYRDGDAMRRALEGTSTLLLVSGSESADRVEEHRTAVRAAADAGVGRVVYTSFLAAAPDATFTFARDHWHTEGFIRESGMAWTFLRDGLYLDFVPSLAGADGVIRGPADDGRVAPVARDDVVDCAVAALLDPVHAGQTYDLTGPETSSMRELATLLGELAGRAVSFVDETMDEAFASRAGFGAPDWEVAGWVSTYAAIGAGELDVVTGDVARVAGHPPVGVREWLEAHPESLAALRQSG